MKKIAIFASGSGSNAENIILFFEKNRTIGVNSVFCNVPNAYVLERAKKHDIPAFIFSREEMKNPEKILKQLQERGIDLIVLAGFLWLMPECIISAYKGRIVNIHPALLPNYGGKGMYGMHVHEAIIAAGEKKSGITIHYVNSHYDEGATIFQATCDITKEDTPDTLAAKIHNLEHDFFPITIEKVLNETPAHI